MGWVKISKSWANKQANATITLQQMNENCSPVFLVNSSAPTIPVICCYLRHLMNSCRAPVLPACHLTWAPELSQSRHLLPSQLESRIPIQSQILKTVRAANHQFIRKGEPESSIFLQPGTSHLVTRPVPISPSSPYPSTISTFAFQLNLCPYNLITISKLSLKHLQTRAKGHTTLLRHHSL